MHLETTRQAASNWWAGFLRVWRRSLVLSKSKLEIVFTPPEGRPIRSLLFVSRKLVRVKLNFWSVYLFILLLKCIICDEGSQLWPFMSQAFFGTKIKFLCSLDWEFPEFFKTHLTFICRSLLRTFFLNFSKLSKLPVSYFLMPLEAFEHYQSFF